MAGRLRIAIFGAVFFGFIAAYGVYNFLLQQRNNALQVKVPTQDLLVAAKDIEPGTSLTQELLKVASWTTSSVPKGTFAKADEVIGKVLTHKALLGDPITQAKLSTLDETGLTVRLAEGYRAMAVKVDEVIGVSGFIAPNDRVDVITTMNPPGKTQREDRISKIVLQNKRVLSIASEAETTNGAKPKVVRSITLEVTPAEAEKLTLAAVDGNIILALRGRGDRDTVATNGSSAQELLALTAPEVAKASPSQQRYEVEMYLGTQKSVVQF